MYAIVYSRTNVQLQIDQEISRQEQQCVKFALSQGYIVKEEALYREVGSGAVKYQERHVLVKILNYIDQFPKRKFVLIVAGMERISRNRHNLSAYGEALYSRGVLIESTDYISKQSIKDQMLEELICIFSRYERNVRRERALSARRDGSGVDHKE
jgi:DNA invertase Pin-like site-specific DNA recombinase